jgi:hypothetical protein
MNVQKVVKCALVLLAVVVLGMMVNRYNEKNKTLKVEKYTDSPNDVTGSNKLGENEVPAPVSYPPQNLPSQCYPRDRLTADDLLPKDAANSKFAQVNPAGQGDVNNANYLTAGWQEGINTVGNSLRNGNQQLRSEPPNPQVKVSPWNMTTIDPDLSRRPLE